MDDSKVFMFPDGGTRQTSSDANSLLPLLMCNGGFGGGNWVWIIFLFFLYPLMRNGGLFGNMGQNSGGIPLVAATQTTAGSATANAVFSMPNHTFRAMGVAGIMVINFNAATTTATGFEIMVNNITLPLLASNGEALTALTAGLHIIVFDKQNNKLQLIV